MTSYRHAGVDLGGADRHVARIAPIVESTWDERVVGGFGGFAAGVTIPSGYDDAVLMLSTDGVGTKLEIAARTGRWDGVGFDLVAMCVDDLTAAGAEPVAFVDYMAVGALSPDRDASILDSIARACKAAGAALIGGETAEHPGVMQPDQVDLAGTALGVVERTKRIDGSEPQPGDQVIGLVSPNLRSNGFSLVRQVFAGHDLDETIAGLDGTLAEVLLEPSVLYAPHVRAAMSTGGVRGAAHITGGGLPENLPRTLPGGLGADLDTTTWHRPTIYDVIAAIGSISLEDMASTFNLGIGFCLVVRPQDADDIVSVTAGAGARIIGEVTRRPGVRFVSAT